MRRKNSELKTEQKAQRPREKKRHRDIGGKNSWSKEMPRTDEENLREKKETKQAEVTRMWNNFHVAFFPARLSLCANLSPLGRPFSRFVSTARFPLEQ